MRFGWRHLRSVLLLPFVVTVVVPMLLVLPLRSLAIGWPVSSPLQWLLRLIGVAALFGGLRLVVQTVRLFAHVGEGTLAPWDPPQKLVLQGPYRYVRNPMISGVMAILVGETAIIGSVSLLMWAIGFIIVNMIFIPVFEEPQLLQRFGADYQQYRQHVPRWLPRRTPWDVMPELSQQ